MPILTKHQQETIDRLDKKQYGQIKQADVTRLLKRVIVSQDDTMKKSVIKDSIDYEKSKGIKDPTNYLRLKLSPEQGKAFANFVNQVNQAAPPAKDPFSGKGVRVGDINATKSQPQPERDIGELLQLKDNIQSGSSEESSNARKIIEYAMNNAGAIQKQAAGAKAAYDKAPGGDAGSKLLFYTVPELAVVDQMSKSVGLGWTNADDEYLQHVLDPNYQGEDKQSFTKRVGWVARLLANPSAWTQVSAKGLTADFKKSPQYEWFQNLFKELGTNFDNKAAKQLQDDYDSTKDPFYNQAVTDKPNPLKRGEGGLG